MEKAQDTTPGWQKGANCISDRTVVAMKDLLDTAGKKQRRGKLNCVRLALIDAIFSHQTAWLK